MTDAEGEEVGESSVEEFQETMRHMTLERAKAEDFTLFLDFIECMKDSSNNTIRPIGDSPPILGSGGTRNHRSGVLQDDRKKGYGMEAFFWK
ncbi:hypothetical protein HK104_005459 [Borealophlyctis nickersoniae]|nr:hypothetical protein HK104_005459 [Borealophlyctis nickersoniae]